MLTEGSVEELATDLSFGMEERVIERIVRPASR
jgi:hypothetical protein